MEHSTKDELLNLSLEINKLFNEKGPNQTKKWSLLKEYHTQYLEKHYASIMLFSSYHAISSTLLDVLKPTLFVEKWQEKQFDDIFLHGIHHESFMILVRKLDASCESYQRLKILNLLEKFLQGKSMDALILKQCLINGSADPEYIASSSIWNDLITLMVSLPERVANKTKGIMHKIFHMDYYVPLVTSSVLKALSSLHIKMTQFQTAYNLEFIGKLLGKLCVLGYSDVITQRLSLVLIRRSEDDQIWKRISQKLIANMPFASLEPFVTHLLVSVPWYGYVDWILGEEGIKNSRLSYILKTKLILVRHFKKPLIVQNIIGYYAGNNTCQEHFWNILKSLLQIWSDESALKHQSAEQQKYLAWGLIICAGWINKLQDCDFHGEAYMDKALHGTTIRIGNSEDYIRNLGMVVGGLLINALKPDENKLEFNDLADKELISEFNDLLVIPNNPGKNFLYSEELNCFEEENSKNNEKRLSSTEKDVVETDAKLQSDSDDDLEPYETVSPKSKRPFYLNDVLQGLIEQENADWFEECFNIAESLIEANSDIVHEMAIEMTKVVLHLEDKYRTQDFDETKIKILVSLAVHSPILVSEYLGSQFYEKEYNIKQRLDMLDVLAQASRVLSKPSTEAPLMKVKCPSKEKFGVSVEKTWKSIVDQRIASKTRYITKTPRQSLPETQNRFSPVAGYFFYPLLSKYDKSNPMLKLFNEDSYVLGRLIYTLGTVMLSASNIPTSKAMGETLLQFLVDVRNHIDVFVRQASIFAIATVYSSVPGYLLFSEDMVQHVDDSKLWLQSIIEQDPDTNCQLKASYALSYLIGIIQQEVPQLQGVLTALK